MTLSERVVDVILPETDRWPNQSDTFIRQYPNVVPLEVCEKAWHIFKSCSNKTKGRIAGTTHDGTLDPKVKSSLDVDVGLEANSCQEWLEVGDALRRALEETIPLYANEITPLRFLATGTGLQNTGLQFQYYEPNGLDGFRMHIDRATLKSSRRELAIVIYLNDVEEGGETFFPIQNIAVKPEAGKVVWFPAGFTHPHEGRTPISGPKLIASTFMAYIT
jgi:hypothetical protein